MKILIVGDKMTDKYVWGDIDRISPEAPIVVVKVKEITYSPGGAGNVEANLKSLGVKTRTFYSDNEIIKERIFSRGQQVMRVDTEDASDKKYSKKKLKKLREDCKWADWIVVSDYAKGTVTKEVWNVLNPFKKKTIVDPKPKNKEFYKDVYLIKPNEKEVVEMTGELDIERAGLKLSKELNTDVIITRGKIGSMLIKSGKVKNYPTKPSEVGSSIGAGDTFLSVLVYYLNERLDKAIKKANRAGQKAVSKLGTYIIKIEDL